MLAGGLVALVVAFPFAIGARIAADGDNDALAIGLSIAASAGFFLGAVAAAWLQRTGTPLSHGLVTAGGTYLLVQAALIAVRLVRGNHVRWFGTLFTFTFVLLAGLLGGIAGQRMRSAGVVPNRERDVRN